MDAASILFLIFVVAIGAAALWPRGAREARASGPSAVLGSKYKVQQKRDRGRGGNGVQKDPMNRILHVASVTSQVKLSARCMAQACDCVSLDKIAG
jgi:hypothetical protein